MFTTVGFVLFSDEYDWFSDSFMREMSKQLEEKFISMMRVDTILQKYFFELHLGVGLKPEIKERDGIVYALVNIVSPDSMSRQVYVCWYSDDFTDKINMHHQDTSGKNIIFNWCNDFPREELIRYIKPRKEFKKGNNSLNFALKLFLYNLPDAYIQFTFKGELDEGDRFEIWNILNCYNESKGILFHLSAFDNDAIHLDYNIQNVDCLQKILDDYIAELVELFKRISLLPCSDKIISIQVV